MARPDPPHATAWLGRAFLIAAVIAAAVMIALRAGVITFGTGGGNASAQPSTPAAVRTAANAQWASAMCTNLLHWKTALQRDATSLNPGLGPGARLTDAVTTTTNTLSALQRLGPPPAAHDGQDRAETDQLRADIARRAADLQRDLASLTSGNLAAMVTVLGDIKDDSVIAAQVVRDLRHVISIDLGLSLAETHACRALVGIPV